MIGVLRQVHHESSADRARTGPGMTGAPRELARPARSLLGLSALLSARSAILLGRPRSCSGGRDLARAAAILLGRSAILLGRPRSCSGGRDLARAAPARPFAAAVGPRASASAARRHGRARGPLDLAPGARSVPESLRARRRGGPGCGPELASGTPTILDSIRRGTGCPARSRDSGPRSALGPGSARFAPLAYFGRAPGCPSCGRQMTYHDFGHRISPGSAEIGRDSSANS